MSLKEALLAAKEKGELFESSAVNISYWLESDFMPVWVKASIEELINENAWEELNDRFYRNLAFGTGGMRGRTIGRISTCYELEEGEVKRPLRPAVGTNVLNDFTIIKATIGLYHYVSEYLKSKESIDIPRFVIAHDVRYFSRHFCELCASTWTQLGGQAIIFEDARSTPQLSFSVRHYSAHCGAVLTASHNPYHDNGFKVYFDDGAQVVAPHAESIVDAVNAVDLSATIPFLEKCLEGVNTLDESADDAYKNLLKEVLSNEVSVDANLLKVVFSPIHGTGAIISVPLLKEMGIDVHSVEEQDIMDSAFSTVNSPNPENASALKMALDKAEFVGADVVIATDPDADRMGVAVRDAEGSMKLLSGNQVGSLLADYRIKTLKERKILPEEGSKNAALIKTFVTTPMQDEIGKAHGLKVVNTLTGFKWIGKKLANYEAEMADKYKEAEGIDINYDTTDPDVRADIMMDYSTFFVCGGEESYGYLNHDVVRDKDANAAAILFAEMAAYYKSENLTVMEALDRLYLEHGFFAERMINIYYEGAIGAKKIANILKSYRDNPPKNFGDIKVNSVKDFGVSDIYDEDGEMISKQDFFFLECSNGYSFAVRGSGTEPKIKFYVFAQKSLSDGKQLSEIKSEVGSDMKAFMELIETDAYTRAE